MRRVLPVLVVPALYLVACPDEQVAPIDVDRDPVGEGEGEGEDGGEGEGEGEGGPVCDDDALAVAEPGTKKRLLVTFPFTAAGSDGTTVGAFTVEDGVVTARNASLDVGFRPNRVEFLPSGRLALVLGEDGELATVDTASLDALRVIDTVALPSAGYGDLTVTTTIEPLGMVVYVTGANVTEEAGVARVRVGCDGLIDVDTASFFGLRLTESLALLPGNRALLFGGQVTGFEPRDDDDVRLLQLGPGRPTVVDTFDVFTDFMNATRIGAATDGSFAVLPNASTFSAEGGDIVVVDIDGDVVSERGRLQGFVTASEAIVAPDNTVAAVSQWEEDAVVIVDVRGPGAPAVATTITGVGLAEQMALVPTGTHAGRVFVPEVRPSGGSFITAIDLGAGTGTKGASFALGDGSEQIPVGVAVQR